MKRRWEWFAQEVAKTLLKLSGAQRVHIRCEYEDGNSLNFESTKGTEMNLMKGLHHE